MKRGLVIFAILSLIFISSVSAQAYTYITPSLDTCSSINSNYPQYSCNKVIDGSTGTQSLWFSANGWPQWIYFDIGSLKNINGARIYPNVDYNTQIRIQTSSDAITWATVLDPWVPIVATWNTVSFSPVQARYLRIYGYSGAASYNSLTLYEAQLSVQTICTPQTCSGLGKQCGAWSDGCGGTLSCGSCTSGNMCDVAGQCVAAPVGSNICNSPEDIIMTLFSQKDSHGALWNDLNYLYDICYSQVFGTAYLGTNTHSCTASNKELWLSGTTNAHAATIQSSIYNTPICYGDLVCTVENIGSGTSCNNANEKIVARLFSMSNSHISDKIDTTYPYAICCSSANPASGGTCFDGIQNQDETGIDIGGVCSHGIPGTISQAKWKNMIDVDITNADLKDRVKLAVVGADLTNQAVEYQVFKSVAFWFDSKVSTSSTNGFTTWKAGDDGAGGFFSGTYYFKVRVVGTTSWVTSGNLVVSATEVNTGPFADILTPADKAIFYVGQPVSFTQNSYDPDDNFDYFWDISDGEALTGNNVNNNSYYFSHTYSTTGQKDIKLKVIDERGKIAIDKVSILIVDPNANRYYTFANIKSPLNDQDFFIKNIPLDATDSYAVQVVPGPTSVNCIAGNCPSTTLGSPKPYTGLQFSWIFDDTTGFTASGMNPTVSFPQPGTHKAKLTATYTPQNAISTTETKFNIFLSSSSSYCSIEDGNSYWYETSGGIGSINPSVNDCNRAGIGVCCPSNLPICDVTTGKCTAGPNFCADYAQPDCNSVNLAPQDLANIKTQYGVDCGDSTKNYGTGCYEYVICSCKWNTGTTKCEANVDHKIGKDGVDFPDAATAQSQCVTINAPIGTCKFNDNLVDECAINGYITKTSTTTWSGTPASKPAYCVDGVEQVPCEDVVKLNFFGITQFILALISICFIYLIIKKR